MWLHLSMNVFNKTRFALHSVYKQLSNIYYFYRNNILAFIFLTLLSMEEMYVRKKSILERFKIREVRVNG